MKASRRYINRLIAFFFCLLISGGGLLAQTPQQKDSLAMSATDTIAGSDTVYTLSSFVKDTLQNEYALQLIFKPYETITNTFDIENAAVIKTAERKLPTIKEVKLRNVQQPAWIFWFAICLVLFISFTRISNPRQFETFVAAVFDMQANEKLWNDKNRNYFFLYIAFFLFYISTLAFFMTVYSVKEGLIEAGDYLPLLASLLFSLGLMYTGKFAVYFLTGFLIDTNRLVSAIVASIVSINAFVALILFPLVVFYAYSTNSNLSSMFYHTIFTLFVLGLLYRFFRFIMAGNSYFRYSNIYLFVYLCALEICPWLIIIKLFKHYLS